MGSFSSVRVKRAAAESWYSMSCVRMRTRVSGIRSRRSFSVGRVLAFSLRPFAGLRRRGPVRRRSWLPPHGDGCQTSASLCHLRVAAGLPTIRQDRRKGAGGERGDGAPLSAHTMADEGSVRRCLPMG